jgi:hypothetical protein
LELLVHYWTCASRVSQSIQITVLNLKPVMLKSVINAPPPFSHIMQSRIKRRIRTCSAPPLQAFLRFPAHVEFCAAHCVGRGCVSRSGALSGCVVSRCTKHPTFYVRTGLERAHDRHGREVPRDRVAAAVAGPSCASTRGKCTGLGVWGWGLGWACHRHGPGLGSKADGSDPKS